MPKRMTDKDRLLAFAFRATADELEDAIGVFKAALSAKRGGPTKRGAKRPAKPATDKAPDADNQ